MTYNIDMLTELDEEEKRIVLSAIQAYNHDSISYHEFLARLIRLNLSSKYQRQAPLTSVYFDNAVIDILKKQFGNINKNKFIERLQEYANNYGNMPFEAFYDACLKESFVANIDYV